MPKTKLQVIFTKDSGVTFQLACLAFIGFAQQSVHLTLGILRHPKHFLRCRVFSTPKVDFANSPAQVTQTVRRHVANISKGNQKINVKQN
jgi:hypothetical protein